jgi:hypothetical protein
MVLTVVFNRCLWFSVSEERHLGAPSCLSFAWCPRFASCRGCAYGARPSPSLGSNTTGHPRDCLPQAWGLHIAGNQGGFPISFLEVGLPALSVAPFIPLLEHIVAEMVLVLIVSCSYRGQHYCNNDLECRFWYYCYISYVFGCPADVTALIRRKEFLCNFILLQRMHFSSLGYFVVIDAYELIRHPLACVSD